MATLKAKLFQVETKLRAIKLELTEQIMGLPQKHPGAIPVGNSSAFVIMKSDLTKDLNLDARHYDFAYQSEFLCQIIDSIEPFKFEKELKKIIETSKTKYWFEGNNFGTSTSYFKFHPDVISELKKIVDKNFPNDESFW